MSLRVAETVSSSEIVGSSEGTKRRCLEQEISHEANIAVKTAYLAGNGSDLIH